MQVGAWAQYVLKQNQVMLKKVQVVMYYLVIVMPTKKSSFPGHFGIENSTIISSTYGINNHWSG